MNLWISNFRKWLNDAANLLLPRRCVICRHRLLSSELCLCSRCYSLLPLTHLKGRPGNATEKLFWGQFPIVRASAFLRYQPDAPYAQAIMALKYGNRPQVGVFFGEIMAEDLTDSGFFDDIDCIIPIPLAADRLRKRGYNQSEAIAEGISSVTRLPVRTDAVLRVISNPSQTRLSAEERKKNVKGIFALQPHHHLDHRHVLLVDDILTTGATIASCAAELAKAEGIRISVLTLGLAGSHPVIKSNKEEEDG